MMPLLLALLATEAVVAHAGEAEITSAQLRQRVAATRAAGGEPTPESLVQDLVNEALFAQEGSRLGLQKDPAVVAAVEAARRRAASERMLADTLGQVKVEESQLLDLYHSSSDWVTLQLLVLATEAEARAALERLGKGATFAAEAVHSLDPDNAAGQGARSRGQLPKALAEAAFAATVGALTGPVKLELGWAVLRVRERQLGDPGTYKAKRDDLRKFAEQQTRARMRSHLVEQLRKQAKASVDDAFLKGTGARLQATPQELEHVVAEVREQRVRYADVVAEVRRLFGGKEAGHASGPGVKLEMAWSLVDRLLLEDAAVARKLDGEPVVRAAMKEAERDALVTAVSARTRAQAPRPGDGDLAAYYSLHTAAFQRPARHPCAHILVATREEATRLGARAQGGEAFAALARDFSRDAATAANGGAIGEVPDDRLDELDKTEPELAAALRGRAGVLSAPAKSRAGWHLVRCEPVIPAAQVPLAEVKDSIAALLSAQWGAEALRKHIAELRKNARIEVVPGVVLRAITG